MISNDILYMYQKYNLYNICNLISNTVSIPKISILIILNFKSSMCQSVNFLNVSTTRECVPIMIFYTGWNNAYEI